METADRELVFSRVLDAPRELVYTVWTQPEHLVRWWGPSGFTTTVQEMDVRPGGDWRLTMRGPDGRDYRNRIVFQEVAPPEKLVYTLEPEPGSEPVTFETAVTFADEAGKTRVTMRMLFPTPAVRKFVVETYGAVEGAYQTLDRLAGYLGDLHPAESKPEMAIARLFDAHRTLVFAAWAQPDSVARWWGPESFTSKIADWEFRSGGAIRLDMHAPDGTIYPMAGTFVAVEEPERVVFDGSALDSAGEPLFTIRHTVTFDEHGGKTLLKVEARVLRATAAAAPHLSGMETGWTQQLDRLAAELAA